MTTRTLRSPHLGNETALPPRSGAAAPLKPDAIGRADARAATVEPPQVPHDTAAHQAEGPMACPSCLEELAGTELPYRIVFRCTCDEV